MTSLADCQHDNRDPPCHTPGFHTGVGLEQGVKSVLSLLMAQFGIPNLLLLDTCILSAFFVCVNAVD